MNVARSAVTQAELADQSLKSRVFRAGGWTLTGHFLALVIRFLGTLILSRIFAPEIFGILAVVTAVQTVIALVTDIGIRQAIIQSPNGLNRSFLNTAFTVQVLRGILIWSLGAVTALVLHIAGKMALLAPGSVYAYPGLPVFILVTSFSAAIIGFQSMKTVTAARDLDLKRVTLIELLSQIIGLVVVVLFGWATRSIWSYIIGLLVVSVIAVLLSHIWLRGPMDRFSWNAKDLKELTRFGRWVFVSSSLGTIAGNGDRLLLAGWISPGALGYYAIANSLVSVVDGVAARVFGAISLPALSEVLRSQPDRLPEVYTRIRWLTDSAIIGMAGFLFATGGLVIEILYDTRYLPAGWMLQWLSFTLFFARYGLAQSAYLAIGRPNYVTMINAAKLISLFSLVPTLFYLFGERGAIIGIAFHMLPSTLMTFYFNWRHRLNYLRLEMAVLGFWLLGWLLGEAVVRLAAAAKSLINTNL